MSLKNMPKSFDMTCKKGYYPTSSTRPTTYIMRALIPNPNFTVQSMPANERAQFMQWYEELKSKLFCNKSELQVYCTDDVNVLRQACCAFRNLFLKLVKMDPFREAIILSSICSKEFWTMFLKPDAVGIITRAGFRRGIVSLLRVFNDWRIWDGIANYSCW
jgi:hypothetical protein